MPYYLYYFLVFLFFYIVKAMFIQLSSSSMCTVHRLFFQQLLSGNDSLCSIIRTYSLLKNIITDGHRLPKFIKNNIRIRIRKSFIAKYVCKYKELVLVTEASNTQRQQQHTDNEK